MEQSPIIRVSSAKNKPLIRELVDERKLMKNILLAITGLTPQVVTETLFVLAVKNKIDIDEIYIVTTSRGKKVIEGKDNSPSTPDIPLKKEISALCKKYNVKQPKFNITKNVIVAEEETRRLYDIRTDKENRLFPNKLATLLKKLTSQPQMIIHASLSGGRKSMSAHLALVMSLLARQNDKLYHIITDEKFEFKNFYPKTEEEADALTLAEIPFVKLRSVNDPVLKSGDEYFEIVQKTQERLILLGDEAKLIIELKQRKIHYKNKSVIFSPTEISIYTIFVQQKIANSGGYDINEIREKEFAKKLQEITEEYFHQVYDSKNKTHWTIAGITPDYFLQFKSKINTKLKNLFENDDEENLFRISSERRWGDTYYEIKAPKEKLGINYE